MFGASSQIASATQACVTALQPMVQRSRLAEPWPPEFWRDAFVLGFFSGTITSVADMTARRRLPTEESGRVLLGTFKELGGYSPGLAERIHMLASEKDADYWQGVRSAEKLIVYMFGGASFNGVGFDSDPDVQAATDMAKETARALGHSVDRGSIGGALAYVLFHGPAEQRLGL
jgi:hypothetical protein